MSTNTPAAQDAGALLEDAIAAVLLNEMTAQRYTATEVQNRSGVKPRSWGNYYVNRSREIPTWAWVATGEALGLGPVDVIGRARQLIGSLTDAQADTLSGVSGSARVLLLREIAKGQGRAPAATLAEHIERQLSPRAQEQVRLAREQLAEGTSEGRSNGF